MLMGSLSIMAVGFGLGLMHALDADHVMAVSALGNQKPGRKRVLSFCANWAVGHSGVLLFSGLLLFGLGLHLPEALQRGAELSVGILLIGLGLWCFWQFRKQPISITEHRHGDIVHRHLHVEGDATDQGHSGVEAAETDKINGHAPVFVGVIHGLAGSAPALALVPAVAQGQVFNAIAYLIVFSVGVLLSMLVFGFGFGALQERLRQQHIRLFQWHRHGISLCSIVIGGYWLHQAW